MFGTFEDIAGDFAPNSGNKTQTIARLFGGDAAAYANFDPATTMTRHGPYQGVSGWFAISGDPSAQRTPGDQTGAANALCGLGSANGINCAVVAQAGKHDWPFAARAFAAALPWLAGQIGTPGIAAVALPGPPVRPPGPVTITAAGGPPGVR
jgi:S-formylglutathione hydrolase FrmB